jgi:GTP-binding protein
MEAIIEYIPAPKRIEGPVQLQVATIDYNNFVGRIGIGRVYRGELTTNQPLMLIKRDGTKKPVQLKQLMTFEGIERQETDKVECGDLCAIIGVDGIDISDTIAHFDTPEQMPPIAIDEPTISMVFRINDSPFFGRDGKYISSRHLRERLFLEVEKDVALRVEEQNGDSFKVSGRGLLHLSILIENMRREGYELAVAKPQVIFKTIDGVKHEPIEMLTVDVPNDYAGKIIELTGTRRGELIQMESHGDRQKLEFLIPTRGLIGYRSEFMTDTNGNGIMNQLFAGYEPYKGDIQTRERGSIVVHETGESSAYGLFNTQDRGRLFIGAGVPVYEGMIVGECAKSEDVVCNVCKQKHLTNTRASGSDDALRLVPPTVLSLEQCMEFIKDDELLEVTPVSLRLRKAILSKELRLKKQFKKN